MEKIILFPDYNTEANILRPNTLFCILVFGAKILHGTKGQKVSTYAIHAAKNYASDLTAKISALCIFPHCVPIRAFTSGCGGEPQHLSFLWTYVKDCSYCQVLEGTCSLLGFPSKLIRPIRSVLGGWEGGCSHGNDRQRRTSV